MKPRHLIPTALLTLLGCTLVLSDDTSGGTSGQGESTGSTDPSATGQDPTASEPSSESSSGGNSDSTGGESTTSTSGNSSGGHECSPQVEPYTACDLWCGPEACGEGMRCVGDAFGYAMCVSPCETVDECEPIGWAAPHGVVICQAAPLAVYPGGTPVGAQRWCWPPCADVDTCPEFDGELLGCTSLGGDRPVCTWPPPG